MEKKRRPRRQVTSMVELIVGKIVPLLVVVGLGSGLRRVGMMTRDRSEFLLQIVIYLALPATVYRALERVVLHRELWLLPLAATIIILVSGGLAYAVSREVEEPRLRGVLVIAPMVMGLGTFLYPFVLSVYGEKGLSYVVFLDATNIFLSATLVFLIAASFGSGRRLGAGEMAQRLGRFPLFWVLVLSFGMRGLGWSIPKALGGALDLVGSLTIPLSLLAMGGFLDLSRVRSFRGKGWGRSVAKVLAIRFLAGSLMAGLILWWARPSPLVGQILFLGASAPIGFTVLAYAVHEKLDAEAMAQCISLSLLVGIFLTPLQLIFLSWYFRGV